ncbi:MAG TPA: lectin-like protein [Kofleriaceae bacterium]|nr:lectin-like protein [Kofleriaceae bacterium]
MRAPLRGVVFGALAACSFRAPTGSGDAATTDAATFACDFPGVQCPGGQPLRILACGDPGECWVGCVNGVLQTPAQAMQFCTNLGMKLGAFDSAADETCVRSAGINGSIMLGIVQLTGQQNDDEGWVRVADDMPASYVNWDAGQPNDGPSLPEDNEEQCAASNTSAQWHDVPCATGGSARWICRRP